MAKISNIWRTEQVQMVLKNCVMQIELARKAGYNEDRYRRICKDNYFVYDKRAYIPISSLKTSRDIEAFKKCTNLDDYLPLTYFARNVLNVTPQSVRFRLKFMRETGFELFEHKRLLGQDLIKIPKELQEKFERGLTYTITNWKTYKDYVDDAVDFYIFGDWCIVFLK